LGIRIAAPIPWSARQARGTGNPGARAQTDRRQEENHNPSDQHPAPAIWCPGLVESSPHIKTL